MFVIKEEKTQTYIELIMPAELSIYLYIFIMDANIGTDENHFTEEKKSEYKYFFIKMSFTHK